MLNICLEDKEEFVLYGDTYHIGEHVTILDAGCNNVIFVICGYSKKHNTISCLKLDKSIRTTQLIKITHSAFNTDYYFGNIITKHNSDIYNVYKEEIQKMKYYI